MALRDELAADAHDSWMESQRANGFTTAISRQTGEEQMVPFDELSDAVKAYDYALVDGFLAALEKRGYLIFGPPESESVRVSFDPDDFGVT